MNKDEHKIEINGREYYSKYYVDKEIERLTNELDREKSKVKEYGTRMLKAIKYIETHQLNFKKGTTTFGSDRLSMEERKLLDIIRGDDKE